MKKEGEKINLGKFGQVRTRQQIRKTEKKEAERIRKENRNLSG